MFEEPKYASAIQIIIIKYLVYNRVFFSSLTLLWAGAGGKIAPRLLIFSKLYKNGKCFEFETFFLIIKNMPEHYLESV